MSKAADQYQDEITTSAMATPQPTRVSGKPNKNGKVSPSLHKPKLGETPTQSEGTGTGDITDAADKPKNNQGQNFATSLQPQKEATSKPPAQPMSKSFGGQTKRCAKPVLVEQNTEKKVADAAWNRDLKETPANGHDLTDGQKSKTDNSKGQQDNDREDRNDEMDQSENDPKDTDQSAQSKDVGENAGAANQSESPQDMKRTLAQRKKECEEYLASIKQLQNEATEHKQEKQSLAGKLAEAGSKIKILEDDLKTQAEYAETMEKKLAESTSKNMGLQRQIGEMERRYKEEMERVESEFQQQNATISMFHKENHSLQKKSKKQEEQYKDQARELQSLRSDYGDLKSRFGKMAGEKMKHDNPDIVNLGDQNRSTKIGERYGALYNEAWTDAWMNQTDELQYAEEDATKNLLDILKNCYDFCKEKAEDHFNQLTIVLTNPVQSLKECSKPTNLKIPATTSTTLREVRKDIAVGAADQIKAAYLAVCEKENDKKFIAATKPFIEQCVELCWVMVLNLPPLYMKFEIKPGTDIDVNLYTKRSPGDKIKVLVWPPLFNGEGGGLLQKGVVEAIAVKKVIKKGK